MSSVKLFQQHKEEGWDKFVMKQRATFVADLRQAEDDLQCLIEPDCGGPGDLADRAADQDARVEIAAKKARLTRVISERRSAIAQIDEGTYGICESCGLPIPLERMQALGYTTLHVKCTPKNGVKVNRR